MKIIKNKKGSPIYPIMIVIGAILILTWAFSVITSKNIMNRSPEERQIGIKQFLLFDVFQKGEDVLFFLDQSAKYAGYQTIHELARAGSYAQRSNCGSYNGYVLLNNRNQVCFPTTDTIRENFQIVFNQHFNEYLMEFLPESQKNDFDLELVQDDDFLIRGSSERALNIIISNLGKIGEISFGEEISYGYGGGITVPSEGKCGFVADYAKMYIGCPYALNIVSGRKSEPTSCHVYGLTCAGLTNAIAYNTLNLDYRGHANQKCNQPGVFKIGKDLNNLQPGDIFVAEWKKSDGTYTKHGHTGMYVGRGDVVPSSKVNYFGSRTCYKEYESNPVGEYIFIHSIGNSELGQPGVCYEPADQLFSGSNVLTNFCRFNECA